jgi:hypothetical protein
LSLSPRAHHGQLLAPSRPARLSLTVRRGSLKMTCDESVVVDWRGDPRRLIRSLSSHLPDSNEFFLGSSNTFLIREMTLTPLMTASP